MTLTGLPIPSIPLRLPARRLLLIPLAPLCSPVRRLLDSRPLEEVARTREADAMEQPLWVECLQAPARTTSDDGVPAHPEGSVHFTRSGRRAVNDGRCLLEQAERAGLCPQFGCRMGICRRCTARKTAGSVRNILSGETSSAADEDIQICVSVPVGDVEIAI